MSIALAEYLSGEEDAIPNPFKAGVMTRIILVLLLFSASTFAIPSQASESPCSDSIELFDLRTDTPLQAPVVDMQDRQRLAQDIFGAPGKNITVNSMVRGEFTQTGAAQTAYLVQAEGPDATTPNAQVATLAIYEDGKLVGISQSVSGNFIYRVVKSGGAATKSLLLRADQYQMATATTGISWYRFDGNAWKLIHAFDEARIDRCEDERFGGDVEAIVVGLCPLKAAGQPDFQVTRYSAMCRKGKQPLPADFSPMPNTDERAPPPVQG